MPKEPDDETKFRTDESSSGARLSQGRREHEQYSYSVNRWAGGGGGPEGGGCALAILAVGALAILGGIGFGVWWFFFR